MFGNHTFLRMTSGKVGFRPRNEKRSSFQYRKYLPDMVP